MLDLVHLSVFALHLLSRVLQDDDLVDTPDGYGEFHCCIVRIHEPQGLNVDRRPKGCALKVTSRSITLHELARTGPVFDTLIPDIGT